MKCYLAIIVLIFTLTGAIIFAMGFAIHGDAGTTIQDRSMELKLLGVFFIISPWITIFFLNLKLKRDRDFTASIMETGTRKSAVLVSCDETGTYVNEAPEVEILLDILDHRGSRRRSIFKGVISITNAVRVKPGMSLEVTESDRGIVIHWPEND